ncbi:hypothetical protein ACFOOK_28075 [Micromonospora krabiensis]|uniref:Uncharacterized protein n=1 Tax=Micromonospora krabiensis TaxID=307121 RepID=A0A1C3N4S9_9ACTN|nr:hypothetical protein [Micromonospora krabiensis]SBV27573.1 hypothetical protein GA0070620_3097 [Micromonospora krabiensis]
MAAQQERGQPPFLIRRLTAEPGLRARIETAERLGVAPRRLDGWEPAETTVYEYDAGRLVRSVTVREPEWSEQDRAWMAALVGYRASLCPCGCGHPAEQTQAHESDGRTFVVPPPVRCRARTALVQAQAQYEDTPQPEALLWSVERR